MRHHRALQIHQFRGHLISIKSSTTSGLNNNPHYNQFLWYQSLLTKGFPVLLNNTHSLSWIPKCDCTLRCLLGRSQVLDCTKSGALRNFFLCSSAFIGCSLNTSALSIQQKLIPQQTYTSNRKIHVLNDLKQTAINN